MDKSDKSDGTYHKVSIKHLGRYCNEFSCRCNHRGQQLQMFDNTLKSIIYDTVLTNKNLVDRES
jgi:hypothetical protein